jgi:hypothetical protein
MSKRRKETRRKLALMPESLETLPLPRIKTKPEETDLVLKPEPKPERLKLACSECGCTIEAGCDCGAPYLPAGARAEVAVARHPEQSDRAIAERIGISAMTVGAARKKSTVRNLTVEKRIGLDGKARKLPKPRVRKEDDRDQFNRLFISSFLEFWTDMHSNMHDWLSTHKSLEKETRAILIRILETIGESMMKFAHDIETGTTTIESGCILMDRAIREAIERSGDGA